MSSAPFPLQPQTFPPPPQKNWFARHLGLTIVLALGVLFVIGVLFVGAILGLVMTSMRQSDVYAQALERARQSPEVVEALGKPIEPGWFISGSINVSGPSGNADLAIPVSGPKGKGTIYAVGRKAVGEWEMVRLEVEVRGRGRRIQLLKPLEGEAPPIQEQ